MPLASLIVDALAGLRDVANESRPADASCPTREFPRIAVSPKLAALIHAVDAAMNDEFGAGGFGFEMVAADGVIAGHHALDGFVVPIVALATPPTPPTPPADS
ncbi:MAG: hypothetical protein K8U57_05670 [Planctomycetes bacterium]|nr:hypothetical protein [Planctomycetota bacterium]